MRRRPAIQVTTNWTWYSWAWPHQHGENNHRLNSNSRVTSFTLLQLRNTIYLLYFMHRMQNEEWSWVHRCLLSLMWVPHRAAAGQGGAVRANGEKLLLFVIDGDVLLLSTLYLNIIYQPAPFLAPLPGPRVWLQAASSLARPPSMPLDGVDTPRYPDIWPWCPPGQQPATTPSLDTAITDFTFTSHPASGHQQPAAGCHPDTLLFILCLGNGPYLHS